MERTGMLSAARFVLATYVLGASGVVFGNEHSLAPYFHVEGRDSSTEQLPLKETSAQVDIAGAIARVKVKQVYENTGTSAIEAVYVFPGSTRAAVHGMRMRIGERTIEARIDKKEAARQTYEAAKNAGQRASLLEQQRPNVFTMNVANIMPRDRVEVELDYTELLVPERAVYELVYPTVVGPRYGGGANPVTDRWIANPYCAEGAPEPYKFDIRVRLETGIPIKELSSPSHKVAVDYESQHGARVRLDEKGGGNKDFVLRYRLAGDRIETGLLLFPGEKENFFALMVEPPQRPEAALIPPREYIFLLDVSGSMHGFPLQTAKELMRQLLTSLKPTDTFNVALFAGSSHVMEPNGSIPATAANIQRAVELVDRQQGGGGTELLEGLRAAYRIPKTEKNVSRTVVVVTDGYVGVEAETYRFVRERLDQANLFAFGIGSSVNRGLIEGMARAGQGEPFVVLGPQAASAEAQKLRTYIDRPVLTGISVRYRGFDAYEVSPMKVPDLMAERPIVIHGKYRGRPEGRIELSGFSGRGRVEQTAEVSQGAAKPENAALKWLWARKQVESLEDQHHLSPAKEIAESITDLGLAYSLLTSFTSFVAVDSEVVNRGGAPTEVKQPLPLPQGVSNMAVGQAMGSLTGAPRAPMKARAYVPSGAQNNAEAEDELEGRALGGGLGFRGTGSFASAPGAPPEQLERRRKPAAERMATPLQLRVVETGAVSTAASAAARKAIESKLEALSVCGGLLPGGSLKLKVKLDGKGKVASVEVVKAPAAALTPCLATWLKSLAGLEVGTQAGGFVELVLQRT